MSIDFENYSAGIEMYAPGFVKNDQLCFVEFTKASSDRRKVEELVNQMNEERQKGSYYVTEFKIPVEITEVFRP